MCRGSGRDAHLHTRNVFGGFAENVFGMSLDRPKNVSRQMGPEENVVGMSHGHTFVQKMCLECIK